MSRRLPKNRTAKQESIIQAAFDYFGSGITEEDKKSAGQIALFLMGRKRGVSLNEEEKSAAWAIKQNLPDYLNAV